MCAWTPKMSRLFYHQRLKAESETKSECSRWIFESLMEFSNSLALALALALVRVCHLCLMCIVSHCIEYLLWTAFDLFFFSLYSPHSLVFFAVMLLSTDLISLFSNFSRLFSHGFEIELCRIFEAFRYISTNLIVVYLMRSASFFLLLLVLLRSLFKTITITKLPYSTQVWCSIECMVWYVWYQMECFSPSPSIWMVASNKTREKM